MVINVLAYFFFQHGEITLGDPSNAAYVNNLWDYAYIPRELTDGVQCHPSGSVGVRCTHEDSGLPALYITVFTSLFMHGGLLHLAGNMLFLWIFGNNVEDALGRLKFLLWYLSAGLAATALQTIVTLHWGDAQEASIPNVGASGAIAGVLGAYFVLHPRANVLTAIILGFFFLVREVPAIFFLGIWFLFQAIEGGFSIIHPEAGGGVAFFAHVGGFVFGLLTVLIVAARRPRPAYARG